MAIQKEDDEIRVARMKAQLKKELSLVISRFEYIGALSNEIKDSTVFIENDQDKWKLHALLSRFDDLVKDYHISMDRIEINEHVLNQTFDKFHPTHMTYEDKKNLASELNEWCRYKNKCFFVPDDNLVGCRIYAIGSKDGRGRFVFHSIEHNNRFGTTDNILDMMPFDLTDAPIRQEGGSRSRRKKK